MPRSRRLCSRDLGPSLVPSRWLKLVTVTYWWHRESLVLLPRVGVEPSVMLHFYRLTDAARQGALMKDPTGTAGSLLLLVCPQHLLRGRGQSPAGCPGAGVWGYTG